MYVRKATDKDCRPMWEWWNDPVTRQMMKDNNPVPFESHKVWFEKAIQENTLRIINPFEQERFYTCKQVELSCSKIKQMWVYHICLRGV